MAEETVEQVLQSDPFYDEDVHLDLATGPKHIAAPDAGPELSPEVVTNVDELIPSDPEPEPEAVVPEPEPEPLVIANEDGSSITIEKSKRGWKATADTGTGSAPEVFYGNTKDELLQNVLVGKINATRKIRDLNRKAKLGSAPAPVAHEQPAAPAMRELSADDIFTIKSQLEDNPALAMNTAFQKMTGFSMQQLVQTAINGNAAWMELYREQVGRDFTALNPDYYPVDDNYWAMIKWLAKFKLSKHMTDQNEEGLLNELVAKGLYTKQSLTEAFEDLREDGLLTLRPAPKQEEVEEEEPKPQPAPRPAPVKQEQPIAQPVIRQRPRAGLGIRTSEARPVRPAEPDALPKNLDDLTDEQISELYSGIRQLRQKNPQFVQSEIEKTRLNRR
jgi:hypothetical protein